MFALITACLLQLSVLAGLSLLLYSICSHSQEEDMISKVAQICVAIVILLANGIVMHHFLRNII
ncbi:hypothetical protein GJ688_15110 [Heliobacillus mobilis]|uniref:Uncharacterized protein n=1 Tax=Heliobacterium mobile TaxID=28064 RepID=A0A6I3SMR6_HELMO|nr:hypothetical protein [Heliobacterium mobile]MTV50298.1 hypothetical protein [Heliobacterium mobile]